MRIANNESITHRVLQGQARQFRFLLQFDIVDLTDFVTIFAGARESLAVRTGRGKAAGKHGSHLNVQHAQIVVDVRLDQATAERMLRPWKLHQIGVVGLAQNWIGDQLAGLPAVQMVLFARFGGYLGIIDAHFDWIAIESGEWISISNL